MGNISYDEAHKFGRNSEPDVPQKLKNKHEFVSRYHQQQKKETYKMEIISKGDSSSFEKTQEFFSRVMDKDAERIEINYDVSDERDQSLLDSVRSVTAEKFYGRANRSFRNRG